MRHILLLILFGFSAFAHAACSDFLAEEGRPVGQQRIAVADDRELAKAWAAREVELGHSLFVGSLEHDTDWAAVQFVESIPNWRLKTNFELRRLLIVHYIVVSYFDFEWIDANVIVERYAVSAADLDLWAANFPLVALPASLPDAVARHSLP